MRVTLLMISNSRYDIGKIRLDHSLLDTVLLVLSVVTFLKSSEFANLVHQGTQITQCSSISPVSAHVTNSQTEPYHACHGPLTSHGHLEVSIGTTGPTWNLSKVVDFQFNPLCTNNNNHHLPIFESSLVLHLKPM